MLFAFILYARLGLWTQGKVNVVVANSAGGLVQVPQYLLEAATDAGQGAQCNIICTQPRRIAAISVAERVASERGDSPPGTPGQLSSSCTQSPISINAALLAEQSAWLPDKACCTISASYVSPQT